jgi:hypothetical protein
MSRQRPGLRKPRRGDGAALAAADWRGTSLHRAVDRRHPQPWWFSTRTDNPDPGRFDLAAPRGTCYLTSSARAALIEATADPAADDPFITERELERLMVWSGHATGTGSLADLTTPSVPQLTEEVSTTTPYGLPQQWADAADAARWDGVVYRARFAHETAVGLFDHCGAPDGADDTRHRGELTPTPGPDLRGELPVGYVTAVGALDDYRRGPPPS